MSELIVCSHRGPSVYRRTKSGFTSRRGGGGLIGGLAPVMETYGGTWIAAAISPGDHQLAREHPEGVDSEGFRLHLLDIPEDAHKLHYDVISNEYLWFAFHYLFDVAVQPQFDDEFFRAWTAYKSVNEIYAAAVRKAPRASAVFVEDYHLMLLGRYLKSARIRAPLLYFHHTPWCEPDYLSVFPDAVVTEILSSMVCYDVIGFHSRRWASNFLACCERLLPGCRVEGDQITYKGRTAQALVSPVPLDVPRLKEQSTSPKTTEWVERLESDRHDRKLLVRVDRIDLSKNPLRGFLAFEHLLNEDPSIAEEVWFLAMQYPSRSNVDRYRRYFNECVTVVHRINENFGSRAPGKLGPLGWHFADDFHRSLAGLRIYDTLLVNPVYDGLNLVAKEGATINDHNGTLVLSRNAGIFDQIGKHTFNVNPFDIVQTAEAMKSALNASKSDRARRASAVRSLAARRKPTDWITERTAAAGISLETN